jgi:hypothetical protein
VDELVEPIALDAEADAAAGAEPNVRAVTALAAFMLEVDSARGVMSAGRVAGIVDCARPLTVGFPTTRPTSPRRTSSLMIRTSASLMRIALTIQKRVTS